MENLADIGLVGLAVMGENLVLNMESKGFTVAVYNRTTEKVDKFINGRGKGKNIIGTHSIEELIKNLKRPRKVMLMVKAGKPVDDFIDLVIPYLEPGDIIIDGVIHTSRIPTEGQSTWKTKASCISEQEFQVVKKALCLAHLSCPVVLRLPGNMYSQSFRQ